MRAHPAHLAPGRARAPRARWSTYRVDDVSPDMSFLEMLDVLNERLIARGRGAGRVRPRLPRGHLRHVRHGDQRARRTARSKATTTCQLHMRQLQRRRRPSRSSRGGRPAVPGGEGPGRRPLARSTGSSQAGGYVSAPTGAAPGRQRAPGPEGGRRPGDSTRPPASAAAPAWPRARTARRMLFIAAKITHLGLLPQGQPERTDRVVRNGRDARRRGLRRLHEHRRVHGGVPEGDPAGRRSPS